MKLLLASNNKHKAEEFKEIFRELSLDIDLLTADLLNIQMEVEENGSTLEENAEIKAKAFYQISGIPTIADDTGLEVFALNDEPGVHSARYAGTDCNPIANRQKLISELLNIKTNDWSAKFRTVICFYDGINSNLISGKCNGKIIPQELGDKGFGYDSIFIPDGFDKTFAQLNSEEKNSISHRGNAIRNFAQMYNFLFSKKLKLGFLASGGGSNMQAIIDAIKSEKLNAEAKLLICNNSSASAIEKAKIANIPYKHISSLQFQNDEERDNIIAEELINHDVELVILAGYMKKIGLPIINKYPNKILNIHPSLLPKFGGEGMYGMNVHKAVIAAGEQESGCTIHLVNDEYDKGKIISQMKVQVSNEDTAESLQKKVLECEHILYANTIQKITNGEIKLDKPSEKTYMLFYSESE